ncbi:MAG TPA: protein phosphatase 2C domain-containing protein [Acidobacteriota bacterium]|nr:protein phosphatase 2C domain-containing protein [Acidobacteriota bacterium]
MREYRKGDVSYRYAAASKVGLVRKNNEDTLLLVPEVGLFGVCDGLGGHAAGEIASSLAADAFSKAISESRQADIWDVLFQAILRANSSIMEEQSRTPALTGMGTTLSAIWIGVGGSNEAAIAHIGDSRIYRYRDSSLEQLTEDHSPVFELYRRGFISKEEMQRHPQKSLIDRCLGISSVVEPQILSLPLHPGDRFLISTDGLTDSLNDDQISGTLKECSLEGALGRLFEDAYRAGAPDNITVVLVEIIQPAGITHN